jgi:hypothetical protein
MTGKFWKNHTLLHNLMYLLNFGINVLPDPVKFLQMTGTGT